MGNARAGRDDWATWESRALAAEAEVERLAGELTAAREALEKIRQRTANSMSRGLVQCYELADIALRSGETRAALSREPNEET